jgi:energy-coupling factor transporter ATP-binding protein EcfA2
MKKNIYIIIGHGACGKSSLVRALTGTFRMSSKEVRDIEGKNLGFNICVRSRQEVGKTPKEVLKDIESCNDKNILLTLRFHTYNGMPEGKAYVDLLNKTLNVSHIIFLSADKVPVSFDFSDGRTFSIGNSWGNPVNVNASKARKFFDWL